jgi:hypothetical protein
MYGETNAKRGTDDNWRATRFDGDTVTIVSADRKAGPQAVCCVQS